MRGVRGVCLCVALLLWCVQGHGSSSSSGGSSSSSGSGSSGSLALARPPAEDARSDAPAADILTRGDALLNSLFQPERRQARAQRPASPVPKRAQQGSRFALSLDVPTSILSVLIDLAKNQDMRTKAAANAELMARIG